MTAPDKRKPEAVAEAQKALPRPFGVLNGALQRPRLPAGFDLHRGRPQPRLDHEWLKPIKYDFGPFPNAGAWLDRCLSRPAYKAARSTK